jgi:hypothetical protein
MWAEGGLTVAGNITATGFTGNGSALTNLNGANLANGTIDLAKLVSAVQEALCPPGTIVALVETRLRRAG